MNKKDIKHLRWLCKNMIKSFFTLNYKDFMECYYLIRLHLTYTHNEVSKDEL